MDQNFIYILILIVLALILLIIGIIILYFRLQKEYQELKIGKESGLSPEITIDQARQRSQQILEEAYKKAADSLSRADAFLDREGGILQKELQEVEKSYAKSYGEAIESSKVKAEQMIQNIPQDIKITLISAIDSFRISLSQEVTKAQVEANKTIKEAYENAAIEVNKYKEERMKQVDNAILSIVKDVTEKVLGKTISSDEHEKLVQKALEEAKKQKIL